MRQKSGDREDALPRGTDYRWTVMIIKIIHNNNNDNVPLRQDREDALPRGTDYIWILITTIIKVIILIMIHNPPQKTQPVRCM